MDGLIDQAKARLWDILNETLEMERDGQKAEIEVALYQYGNDNLSLRSDYVELILPLTSDVDRFSARLFGLTTHGGEEYCPAAIQKAASELTWDNDEGTVKLLYIAGNEPFNQGSTPPESALQFACQLGITVNAIYCADPNDQNSEGWKASASACDGDFFAINQDEKTVYVASPFDASIEQANTLLNSTYVPLNHDGQMELANQAEQDVNAKEYSGANLASRARFKCSINYKNADWDLVDAAAENEAAVLTNKASLPDSLSHLPDAQLLKRICTLREQRATLITKLQQLTDQRESFVAEATKQNAAEQSSTLGESLKVSLKRQMAAKGYSRNARE